MSTTLPTQLDPPIDVATAKYDVTLLTYLRDVIQALGGEIVSQRNRMFLAVYPTAHSTIEYGTAVAVKLSPNVPKMVPATAANVAAGALILGVLVETTPTDQRGRVAVAGAITPDLSGLTGTGLVRIDPTTAKLTTSGTGTIVGNALDDGTVLLSGLGGGGGGGGGSGDATSIQGVPVSATAPTTDGQLLVFSTLSGYVVRQLTQDDILPGFTIASFAKTGGTANVEVGATVATPAFTASYTGGSPTSATLTDSDGGSLSVTGTPTSFSSAGSFTKTALNASVTWTLTAVKGVTKTATVTQRWGQKIYYGGSSSAGPYNAAFITGLGSSSIATSRAGSFAFSYGAGNYGFICIPSGMGTPSFTISGFAQTLDLVASGVSVTNAYGQTFNYEVYRYGSPAIGTTTFTLVVS